MIQNLLFLALTLSLVIPTSLFSAEAKAHTEGTRQSAPSQVRPESTSSLGTNWCFGQLNEDEKRKLQEEITAVYSKYQKSRNPDELQKDLTRVLENHSGNDDIKKQAEVATLMGLTIENMSQVTGFFDALSALEKEEKPQDLNLRKQMEDLRNDYNELKKIGMRFDPRKGQWDLSGLASQTVDLNAVSGEAKKAMGRLLSADLASKFFDPNRSEAFDLGDYVVRPPLEIFGGGRTSEFNVVTKEEQQKQIQTYLDRLMQEKEEFLKASKEANTLSNAYTGSLLPVFGFERGNKGQTSPEIERDNSYKGMRFTIHQLKGVVGVKPEMVNDLISILQDALRQDSAGLQQLDQKLTQAIRALKTALTVLAVSGTVLATGGLAAPAAFSAALAPGGALSAVGATMGVAMGISAIPAAINITTDVAAGKKFSCSAMEEFLSRGPQAVSNAIVAGAAAGGFGAAGAAGSKILAGSSPYVGQAGASLIGTSAQVGTGAAFLGLGLQGVAQNGREAWSLYSKAMEAEARGDLATASELRIAAFKKAAETGVNLAEAAYGAYQLKRSVNQGIQDYNRVRGAQTVEGALYQPTTKRPEVYEPQGKVSSASDLDSMKPRSFAQVEGDGISVRTVTQDGLETVNVANRGDVIMSGPSGEKYVVKGSKFERLYSRRSDGTVIPEQTPRMVARYDGPETTIKAPWGEDMVVKPGDYIVREGDGQFYRIAQKEYLATYNEPGVTSSSSGATGYSEETRALADRIHQWVGRGGEIHAAQTPDGGIVLVGEGGRFQIHPPSKHDPNLHFHIETHRRFPNGPNQGKPTGNFDDALSDHRIYPRGDE